MRRKILFGNLTGKGPWEENTKMRVRKICYENVDWIGMTRNRVQWHKGTELTGHLWSFQEDPKP